MSTLQLELKVLCTCEIPRAEGRKLYTDTHYQNEIKPQKMLSIDLSPFNFAEKKKTVTQIKIYSRLHF